MAAHGIWNKQSTDGDHNAVAGIYREFVIDAPVDSVWAALRDVGNVHTRLVPGLVVDTVLENETRIVRFVNGLVVRERIVDIDEHRRRVAYSASGARTTYHHASMQVLPDGEDRTRFIWITDLLPEGVRDDIASLIDKGSAIICQHLSQKGAS